MMAYRRICRMVAPGDKKDYIEVDKLVDMLDGCWLSAGWGTRC